MTINTNNSRDRKAIDASAFDNDDESLDSNCVLLDNKTAYGLNVVHDLLLRGNIEGAKRALTELRYNGRLFNSTKFFTGA